MTNNVVSCACLVHALTVKVHVNNNKNSHTVGKGVRIIRLDTRHIYKRTNVIHSHTHTHRVKTGRMEDEKADCRLLTLTVLSCAIEESNHQECLGGRAKPHIPGRTTGCRAASSSPSTMSSVPASFQSQRP